MDIKIDQIGLKIRERRKKIGLTQGELGKEFGVSAAAIANYELGKRSLGVNELARMARILGIPVSYFYEDDEGLQSERDEEAQLEAARKLIERYISTQESKLKKGATENNPYSAKPAAKIKIPREPFTVKDRDELKAILTASGLPFQELPNGNIVIKPEHE